MFEIGKPNNWIDEPTNIVWRVKFTCKGLGQEILEKIFFFFSPI